MNLFSKTSPFWRNLPSVVNGLQDHIEEALHCYDSKSDVLNYNNQTIGDPKSFLAEFITQLQPKSKRKIHTPRFSSTVTNSLSSDDILESYGTPITNAAPILQKNIYEQNPTLLTPKIRDYVVLGSLMMSSFSELIGNTPAFADPISSITLVEDSYLNFALSLHFYSLEKFIGQVKDSKVIFKLIIEENEYQLREDLCNHLMINNPSVFMGMKVILTPYPSSSIRLLNSYLFSQAGLGQRILGFLGNTTDEANQLLAVLKNINLDKPNAKRLNHLPSDKSAPSVFLCASGPSLDQNLEVIKNYQDNAIVVACGSAVRALLTANIQPDVVVCLERGKSLTDDFVSLKSDGFHSFKDSLLIGSFSLDSGLLDMFNHFILFHRPLSSLTSFIKNSKDSMLPCWARSN